MKNYRFGEYYASQYLKSQGYEVEDTTLNPDFWSKDIDFIARKGNEEITIEVKWDNCISDSGNMFIEIITDIDKGKQGWFEFCQADYIFYGDSQNNLFYVFKTDDLRQFLRENKTQSRKAPDYNYQKKVKKVSQGQLVPIKDFSQQYKVQIVMLDNLNQI